MCVNCLASKVRTHIYFLCKWMFQRSSRFPTATPSLETCTLKVGLFDERVGVEFLSGSELCFIASDSRVSSWLCTTSPFLWVSGGLTSPFFFRRRGTGGSSKLRLSICFVELVKSFDVTMSTLSPSLKCKGSCSSFLPSRACNNDQKEIKSKREISKVLFLKTNGKR